MHSSYLSDGENRCERSKNHERREWYRWPHWRPSASDEEQPHSERTEQEPGAEPGQVNVPTEPTEERAKQSCKLHIFSELTTGSLKPR